MLDLAGQTEFTVYRRVLSGFPESLILKLCMHTVDRAKPS